MADNVRDQSARYMERLAYSGLTLRDKLNWYARAHGLTFVEPKPPGKELRERVFRKILAEALPRLSDRDRRYLDTVPLVISESIIFQGRREGRHIINAAATHDKNEVKAITLYYRAIMSKKHLSYEERVDWVRRLLLHEIGHARDHRTDKEMAATDGY